MPGKITLEDLLLDESFINYCKRSSLEDIAKWELFVQQNPAQFEVLEAARSQFFELFTVMALADQRDQEELLKEKIQLLNPTPVINMYKEKGVKSAFSLLLKVTAAAVVVFIIGYLVLNSYSNRQIKDSSLFTSVNGERKSFQLPDGSSVKLNAGSKISINANYGDRTRAVYLEGEAFFEVKHDSLVPFIVHTPTMEVKALGTSFNVKAYPGEKITETSLVSGSVEVTLKEENDRKIILHPNEKVKYSTLERKKPAPKITELKVQENPLTSNYIVQPLSKNILGEVKETAWMENQLEFEDETLANIAQMMERWYGIKVVFEDENLRQFRFTGIFEKEKLETVLSILKESRNFNYEIIPGEIRTVKLYK